MPNRLLLRTMSSRTPVVGLWVVAGICLPLMAQAPQSESLPRFEVASIRPRGGNPPAAWTSSPNRFHDPDATLASLIGYAYDVQPFQILEGPPWIRSERFEVMAAADSAVPESTMRLMVRQLLEERFGLVVDHQSKEMPAYVLRRAGSVGSATERLRPSSVDCMALGTARRARSDGEAAAVPCRAQLGIGETMVRMHLDGVPLSRFAALLERFLNRPIVDDTGLDGMFDITFDFAAEQVAEALPIPAPPVGSAPDGLSIFTALQEQLGLRLVSARTPVPVIVVRAANHPSPN